MIAEDWNRRKQVAKERLTICKDCASYVQTTSQCKECGCIMLAKAMFAFTDCPLGKWGKDEESNIQTKESLDVSSND